MKQLIDILENVKLCGNCEYFVYDNTPKCKLFGKIDPIYGKKYYQSCHVTRKNETECGTVSRYYVRRIPFNEK